MTNRKPRKNLVHFNQIFYFHTEPPCSNKIHPAIKMVGKQTKKNIHRGCPGGLSDSWWKKGSYFWVIHTMFITPPRFDRNFVLFHHTSPIIFTFLLKKMHGTSPNNKNHRQKLIHKFKDSSSISAGVASFFGCLPCSGRLYSRGVNLWGEVGGEIFVFFFGGGLGVGFWRTCCLLTLKNWMTYNFIYRLPSGKLT